MAESLHVVLELAVKRCGRGLDVIEGSQNQLEGELTSL